MYFKLNARESSAIFCAPAPYAPVKIRSTNCLTVGTKPFE